MPESTVSKGSKKVSRLKNIVTQEVSMVDRAANRRRFLVRKQDALHEPDSTQTGVETSPAGEGLLDALRRIVESVEGFSVEPGASADLPAELVESAEAALLKLRGVAPRRVEKNLAMALHMLSGKARDLAFAVESGGELLDAEKLAAAVSDLDSMLQAMMERYPAEKRVDSGAYTKIVEKAALLKSRIRVILDQAQADEAKTLASQLKVVLDAMPAPAVKNVDDNLLQTAAKSGNVDILDVTFETEERATAIAAVNELEATLSTWKLPIGEDTMLDAKNVTEVQSGTAPETATETLTVTAPATGTVETTPATTLNLPEDFQKLAAKTEELKAAIDKLCKENEDLRAQLAKALDAPASQGSRPEVKKNEAGEDADLLFPWNYNDPTYRAELKKRNREF